MEWEIEVPKRKLHRPLSGFWCQVKEGTKPATRCTTHWKQAGMAGGNWELEPLGWTETERKSGQRSRLHKRSRTVVKKKALSGHVEANDTEEMLRKMRRARWGWWELQICRCEMVQMAVSLELVGFAGPWMTDWSEQ